LPLGLISTFIIYDYNRNEKFRKGLISGIWNSKKCGIIWYNNGISMDLSGLKEKISGILEKIRALFKKNKEPESNDASSKTETLKKLFPPSALVTWVNNLLDRAGPDKRKPLLMGLGGLAGVFLILAIAAGTLNSKKRRMTSPEAVPEGLTIAVEELFIPAEPDFVPEFTFERETRRFWSLEDIRPYWKTPNSSDRWREEIKSAVDKLMEGIP
jgi:hypothetical protein